MSVDCTAGASPRRILRRYPMGSRLKLFRLKKPFETERSNDLFLRAMRENCAYHYAHCPEYKQILDEAKFAPDDLREYADIANTSICGLARAVRSRLRKMGIRGKLPVVFSTEVPRAEAVQEVTGERNKRTTVGTVSYMPAIFGCYLASYVIRKLTQQ